MEVLFPEPLVGVGDNLISIRIKVYGGSSGGTIAWFDKDGTNTYTKSFTGTETMLQSFPSVGFIRIAGTNAAARLYFIDLNYTERIVQGKPVFI